MDVCVRVCVVGRDIATLLYAAQCCSIREVRYQHSPLGSSIRYISISSISSTQNTKEKGDRSG